MSTVFKLSLLSLIILFAGKNLLKAQAHANDYLFFNDGAEINIQSGCLVTVQGDATINGNGQSGFTHLTHNGMLWVQGNVYGDNAFSQKGEGTLRLQNKTSLYVAPYETENYQVIAGGFAVKGGTSTVGSENDGSFYNLELGNRAGLVFIGANTDVRGSVDFNPGAVTVDDNIVPPNGTANRIITYAPGDGTEPVAPPENGGSYPYVFGIMDPVPGFLAFKNISNDLEANAPVSDNAYIQGKLRRAIAPQGGDYGFPVGLEPSESNVDSKGIQYAMMEHTSNNYGVITGFFQRRISNDADYNNECNVTVDAAYSGNSHGQWFFSAPEGGTGEYTLTVFPQNYDLASTVNGPSNIYFITKNNAKQGSDCSDTPEGLTRTGLNGLGYFGFAGGRTALPAKEFSMKLNNTNTYIHITWATVNEINTKLFIVERSYDGQVFESITTQPAVGAGNGNYSYNDYTAYNGYLYYRIKMQDFDGAYAYTRVEQILLGNKADISLYPNPAKEKIMLNIEPSLLRSNKEVRIYDILGRLLKQQPITQITTEIDLTSFKYGMYILRFDDGKVLRFIKGK